MFNEKNKILSDHDDTFKDHLICVRAILIKIQLDRPTLAINLTNISKNVSYDRKGNTKKPARRLGCSSRI